LRDILKLVSLTIFQPFQIAGSLTRLNRLGQKERVETNERLVQSVTAEGVRSQICI
jgi:hypothetical protein